MRPLHQICFYINKIATHKIIPNETLQEQQKALRYFFEQNADSVWHNLNIAWPIVMDSITLELKQNSVFTPGDLKQEELHQILNEARKLQSELRSIVDTSRSELGKKGVSIHAEIFYNQAETHRGKASNWQAASVVVLLVNLASIAGLLLAIIRSDESSRIYFAASGILLVSAISYGLVLCVRNFFTEKHNEAINRHKANCLKTYQTFIEGASPEIKNEILQLTTQTIFSTYNPGFLSKEPMQSPSPLMELFRAFGQKPS